MIPLKIHRPKCKFPLVTLTLIGLNLVVFILTYYSKDFESIVNALAFKLGNTAWWSWFTSMFLHANWFHLVGNMVFLYVFGSLLENVLSRLRFILLYVVGGLASALIQGIVLPLSIPDKLDEFLVIGASGAIFSLLAVVAVRFRQNKVTWYIITPLFFLELMFLPGSVGGPIGLLSGLTLFIIIMMYGFMQDVPLLQLITVWPAFTITALATGISYLVLQLGLGLIQVWQGEMSGVAYWAHTGGLIGGLAMVKFLEVSSDATREYLAQDAASLARQGLFKQAALKYEELLLKGTSEPYFLHKAAKSWALAGDEGKALNYFDKAFSGYFNVGKKEEASQVYDDMHNILPPRHFDPKIEMRFASLCQAQYKLAAALQSYSKIFDSFPDTAEGELALLRKAQVYQKMGENQHALNTYNQFLEKYPQSRWTSLAQSWLNQGRIKPA